MFGATIKNNCRLWISIQRSAKVLVRGLVKFVPALAQLAGTSFTKSRTNTLADLCRGIIFTKSSVATDITKGGQQGRSVVKFAQFSLISYAESAFLGRSLTSRLPRGINANEAADWHLIQRFEGKIVSSHSARLSASINNGREWVGELKLSKDKEPPYLSLPEENKPQ